MNNKSIDKIPRNLSQYLRLKAKEYELSEAELSKLIIPGSSGSLIASITYDESKLSEKKINKIAVFFKEDPLMLNFLAGKIPQCIYDLIIKSKYIQTFLIKMLNDK
jgi:hypothetical protein